MYFSELTDSSAVSDDLEKFDKGVGCDVILVDPQFVVAGDEIHFFVLSFQDTQRLYQPGEKEPRSEQSEM